MYSCSLSLPLSLFLPPSFLFVSLLLISSTPFICLSISVPLSLPSLSLLFSLFPSVVLVGLLFPQQKEPAYSAIRMGFALGYILGFLVPLFATFSANLWIEVGILLLSLCAYSLLYFKTQKKEQIFPFCYRKIIQKSNE